MDISMANSKQLCKHMMEIRNFTYLCKFEISSTRYRIKVTSLTLLEDNIIHFLSFYLKSNDNSLYTKMC